MKTSDKIRAKIATAVKHETANHKLANAIVQVAQSNGRNLNDDDVKALVEVIATAMNDVPNYIDTVLAATAGTAFLKPARELSNHLEAYWMKADDIIPDHHGMIGVLDDAYCCFASLDRLSKSCVAQTGRALLPDLAEACAFFRGLIGEPTASQLDALVGREMKSDPWAEMLAALAGQLANLPMQTRHPMWGNMSTNDIVSHRVAMVMGSRR